VQREVVATVRHDQLTDPPTPELWAPDAGAGAETETPGSRRPRSKRQASIISAENAREGGLIIDRSAIFDSDGSDAMLFATLLAMLLAMLVLLLVCEMRRKAYV